MKHILVIGATGKQGGAVVDALMAQNDEYTIISVTRDPRSMRVANRIDKTPSINFIKGDLDDIPKIFEDAQKIIAPAKIWGVYSVQASMGKGVTFEGEIRQGKGMIDESINHGVTHFVYSSVDRGGDEKSWEAQTPIPHFQTKYHIDRYLRDATKPGSKGESMGWTILRPVAFMDNLAPGMPTSVFLTAMRNTMGEEKKMQWVSTSDIGYFGALAFQKPDEFNRQAISLAGDELNFKELSQSFRNATGKPVGTTYSFFGSILKFMVAEVATMLNWFASDGYGADIAKLKEINPNMMDMETWISTKSGWAYGVKVD